jgi:hypothetical protein
MSYLHDMHESNVYRLILSVYLSAYFNLRKAGWILMKSGMNIMPFEATKSFSFQFPTIYNIVACLLKAIIVKPGETAVARQRPGKQAIIPEQSLGNGYARHWERSARELTAEGSAS